ncbi:hypothetical protein E4U57_000346 [Claviceps arundinis]|uniref:Uncharacterized protein n=1 Tax=Claviceps arundinis TaxID=1623583 RepID=A0A9P7MMP3_9HYPO|nr:hypothetical protein E4U57_000346 [Claviceps arundinis]KAG5960094.1 hypothetical protein E4U56_004662 [Claviceps arundinis]
MPDRPSPELIVESQRLHRLPSGYQQHRKKVKLSPAPIAFDFDHYRLTKAQAFDFPVEQALEDSSRRPGNIGNERRGNLSDQVRHDSYGRQTTRLRHTDLINRSNSDESG